MNPENHAVRSVVAEKVPGCNSTSPLLIGDSIHILSQQVHKALIEQDNKAIAHLVMKQLNAGAQALSVNLGPGREMGRLTPWVVNTIRELTDVPLFFSANIMEQQEVLQAHGQHIAINAVTATHDDLVRALAMAREYGSSLVVLLVQSGKIISGIDDRVQLASEVLEQAVLSGLPFSRLYLDPVLTCRPDPVAWHVSRGMPDVGSVMETIALIKQLDSRTQTIAALSNGSEGMAREKKSGFHSRMLSMLAQAGLDAVLLNCLDSMVMRTAMDIQGNSNGVDAIMGQLSSAA